MTTHEVKPQPVSCSNAGWRSARPLAVVQRAVLVGILPALALAGGTARGQSQPDHGYPHELYDEYKQSIKVDNKAAGPTASAPTTCNVAVLELVSQGLGHGKWSKVERQSSGVGHPTKCAWPKSRSKWAALEKEAVRVARSEGMFKNPKDTARVPDDAKWQIVKEPNGHTHRTIDVNIYLAGVKLSTNACGATDPSVTCLARGNRLVEAVLHMRLAYAKVKDLTGSDPDKMLTCRSHAFYGMEIGKDTVHMIESFKTNGYWKDSEDRDLADRKYMLDDGGKLLTEAGMLGMIKQQHDLLLVEYQRCGGTEDDKVGKDAMMQVSNSSPSAFE